MMVSVPIIVLLLVQSSWGYLEESYVPAETIDSSYLYPEDLPDNNDIEVHRRGGSSGYLRFGRNDNKYDEYDDYPENFARPTRSGKTERNDNFIRFGRGKQDFLRFGRDPHRIITRDRTNYLRFGRSVTDEENKKRSKRDTYGEEYKRTGGGSNFLRFGRNSNFMRFGRNPDGLLTIPTASMNAINTHHDATELLNKMKQLHESPLIHLLNELVANMRQENKKCTRDA